jgi:tetratricopeptide (TPR) repeat protein
MSLLIKALQKAEQGKSATVEDVAAQAPATSSKGEFELAPRHEDLSAELKAESGFDVADAHASAKTLKQRQATASAVLRAQQHDTPAMPRVFWIAAGGVLVLLLLGFGFYRYLKSMEQPELVVAHRPDAIQPPAPQVAVAQKQEAAPSEPVSEPSVTKPETESAPVSSKSISAEDHIYGQPLAPQPSMVVTAGSQIPKNATSMDKTEGVKVTKSRVPVAVMNEQVSLGYQAYMAGDDVSAARSYHQALQGEPGNVDAILGLAAVAARQNKTEEAASLYARALEIDPRNALAQSGLITLTSQSDPVEAESRLKSLSAQQPNAAFLKAALGNLYADQGQWPAAQQAYFDAFHLESGNPEYAFNLAVSLDQMGKPELALNYYQQTLELQARKGTASVDKVQLETRIAQIKQAINQ